MIDYTLIAIYEFASRYHMDKVVATNYLKKYGGLDFLIECFEAEHTLSFDDWVDDMTTVCRQNGATI